jgi:hypothetical protein
VLNITFSNDKVKECGDSAEVKVPLPKNNQQPILQNAICKA